jgi:hypothetical protein
MPQHLVPRYRTALFTSFARERLIMRLLLLLPFIGLLWVPFYNRAEPSLFGFPFFYWYQLAWVPATSLLLWILNQFTTSDDEADAP